jgi:DNA-binding transcriptional ArsR family regulator
VSRAAADASVFHAIADPVRRAMLLSLSRAEQAAGDLIEPLDVSQSAASQHLAVLRRAGLVTARRDGRRRVYRVTPEPLYEVSSWVRHFDRFWDDRLARLGRHLDRRAARRPRR